MSAIALSADCSKCAALCCVALAFDKSTQFAIDKAAGDACPNLDRACRCKIHSELENRGFGGCTKYDCYGAGQRVTQEVFDGRSWQDDPALLAPMMSAFETLRQTQELLFLFTEAQKLALPSDVRQVLQDHMAELGQAKGWNKTRLEAFSAGTGLQDARAFLKTLRPYAPGRLKPN